MQADFDDIRFTSSDGTTLIDHWLESKTDSTTADFWVEIPSIPASPNTTMIYIYYGNSSASSASNGDNTFLLFDNFDGVSMDGFSRVSQQTLFSGSGSEDWLGRTVFVDDGYWFIDKLLIIAVILQQSCIFGFRQMKVLHGQMLIHLRMARLLLEHPSVDTQQMPLLILSL